MSDQAAGLLACATCLVPILFGFVLGWIMKRRWITLGFPGALLPGFIRRLVLRED